MGQQLLNLLSPAVRGYLCFFAMICVGEVLFHLVFALVSRLFGLVHPGNKTREVFKGVIERIMLSVG